MRKSMFTTHTLVRISLLIAMSVMLKSFFSLETQIFRLSFFDIPLIILGIFFGPLAALVSGFIVDWMHVLFSPFAFTFNWMTLSTIMWAVIPAIFLYKRQYSTKTLALVIIFTSFVAFSLNTWQLYRWYGTSQLVIYAQGIVGPLLPRIVTMVIKLPIQVYAIHHVLNRLAATFDELSFNK